MTKEHATQYALDRLDFIKEAVTMYHQEALEIAQESDNDMYEPRENRFYNYVVAQLDELEGAIKQLSE